MGKYSVKCYYTFCGCVEVEADSPEQAADRGQKLCDGMSPNELDYVDYGNVYVADENGEYHEM